MRAGFAIDELGNNPEPPPGSANTAFEDVADAQVFRDLANVNCLVLIDKARGARGHRKRLKRLRAVMISSTTPSAKYSCSASPLMLSKGMTAMVAAAGAGGFVVGACAGRKRR